MVTFTMQLHLFLPISPSKYYRTIKEPQLSREIGKGIAKFLMIPILKHYKLCLPITVFIMFKQPVGIV